MSQVSLSFDEFAALYCARQDTTPDALRQTLNAQRIAYKPAGWMLLECVDLCSSRLGQYTILPYGPNNTFKAPADKPISPRGLASDMSTVAAILPIERWQECSLKY